MASNFIQDYVETLIEREIGATIPSIIAPVTPFIARPDALDFETKRRKDFPLPSEFRDVVVPKVETEVTPQQDGGDDPPPSIEITDIVGGLDDDNIETETKPTDFKSRLADAIGQKIDFEYSVELASAEKRASGLGSGVFAKTVGLVPFGGLLSGFGEEQNKQRLEVIAAQAALGVPNFGIGRENNQTVGMGLDVFGNPGSRALSGTLPQGITTQQREEIRDAIEGKSGALGPARAEYLERGGRFDMSKPQTSAMLGFENVVVGSTLPTSLKEALLGFDRLTNPFELARMPSNYYTVTPFEQIQIDREQAAKNRAGDVGSGFTDVSAPSMGLEGDVAAQDNQITPTAINIGIDMDNISGVPTGISLDAGGGPTGGISGLDMSSTFGDDDGGGGYSDNEAGDNQSDSGFGGGGWTAYGGKIGMSNGGFASKTTKIKGVGLIKPEQTFMDTDMVDDRFEFDAEEGDFIVNGPASQRMKPQVNALINYGMDELRKEGVDIRVGNPKIKSKNKVPLIVASSETYIPRIIAEKIGYPVLEALNDTGKEEVSRLKRKLDDKPTDKNKYEASEGTRVGDTYTGNFLTIEEANKALGIKPEPLNPTTLKSFKFFLKKKKPQRGDVEKLLDNLSDIDKLALLIATETISTKDSLETLESVGQVVMNRVNDKQFDFKNVNTLDEVLKQRSYRGEGSKMFQFDGLEPTSVKNRINEFLNKGGIGGYRKALSAAENVLTKGGGEPDYMTERMPFNVLFYDKAGSPKSISRRYDKYGNDIGPNELIDEYGKVGEHTFYTSHMTREYP